MTTSVMFTANNQKIVSVDQMQSYLNLKGLYCLYFSRGLSDTGRVNCAELAIKYISEYRVLRAAMPEWEEHFMEIEREVLACVEALSK